MIIRKATSEDAEGIAIEHVKSWQTTYKDILPQDILTGLSYRQRQKQWAKNIENSNVYVAEDMDGDIIGFSTGGRERTGKYPGFSGELYAIYILEEYQRQGIGKKLLKQVLEELERANHHSVLVWVLEHNPAADFYESSGAIFLDKTDIQIAGNTYQELAYGWDRLPQID